MNHSEIQDDHRRFISLRTKFTAFISLIIIGVCSALSWYVVQQQSEFMAQALRNTGLILATNLAHNSRYPLLAHDTVSLERLMDGAMNAEDVVYVVMTDQEGNPLTSKTKTLWPAAEEERTAPTPLYPNPEITQSLIHSTTNEPVITALTRDGSRLVKDHSSDTMAGFSFWFSDQREALYDFAVLVRQRPISDSLLGALALEQEETLKKSDGSGSQNFSIHGLVQVGLTNRHMLLRLDNTIQNIILITLLIIGVGILATMVLANRIITPLRNLAELAKQVAQGEASELVTPTTHDEVGQLGFIFNQMTEAIREREKAISDQLQTISKQVSRLTTLNQTGTAIASHLDLETLLKTVLHLVVDNVGFTHMLLMRYDQERGVLGHAQTAGMPETIQAQAREMEIPLVPDDSLLSDLVLEGRERLITDVSSIRHQIDPRIAALIDQLAIRSFVCAPLKSQQQVFGFIVADSTPHPSRQEDLDLLTTIGSTVSVAIDNATAYQQLEQLAVTLEQRVDERTKELQSANDQLRELDKLKSAFVSIVSHELRTPMTSIKGLVENLLDGLVGDLTERQIFYLGRVRANVDRLTRMIHDLLDLSRIEAGRMELTATTLSIADLVHEITDSLQSLAKDKGVSLGIPALAQLPPMLADRDKMGQILTNLIHNAIKFTPSGGTVSIQVTMKNEREIQIRVTDTGCGIPEPELKKVFDRFYRSSSSSPDAGGAGLGLAISKSLVELHGGRIWAESVVGKGSDFVMILPIGKPLATKRSSEKPRRPGHERARMD